MLSYEQVRSIENALGPQAAASIIEVLEDIGNRVKADLSGELATKKDIEQVRTEIEKLRGEFNAQLGRMEVMMKVLIGLAILAIALFSPAAAEIIRLLK